MKKDDSKKAKSLANYALLCIAISIAGWGLDLIFIAVCSYIIGFMLGIYSLILHKTTLGIVLVILFALQIFVGLVAYYAFRDFCVIC